MKSLKDFNKEKVQNETLKDVNGGKKATTYACSDGQGLGDDYVYDTNGDGVYGSGDLVLTDQNEVYQIK